MEQPKNKKLVPSRERYEKQNPTLSARMPIEKHDKLFMVLARLNISLPKLLIQFADEQEITTRPLAEARKEGFQAAKKIYAVYYHCAKCGKQTPVTNVEEKIAVAKYMPECGWAHTECPEDK